MDNLHFWYSEKQASSRSESNKDTTFLKLRKNYAIINGEEILYTHCTPLILKNSWWDDMVYLGEGQHLKSEGEW